MRISDWSSDVCSSDLSIQCTTGFMPAEEGRSQANLDRPTQDPPISFRYGSWSLLRRCVAWPHTETPYRTGTLRCSSNIRWSDSSPRNGPAMHCPQDRKSVVWEKKVSVRVDLGGGRNIKKKN